MPTDTQKRIEELLTVLKKDGANVIGSDGKPLSQTVKELEQEINNLKKDINDLKKNSSGKAVTVEEFERRLGGSKSFDEQGVYKGAASNQQSTPTPPVPPKPEEPIIPSEQLTPEQKDLSVEEAKKVYANGWRSITNKHSSEGQTTENIDQKIHQKGEIEKAHNLLKRIKNETDLSKLPKDGEIGTGAYDEGKVPSGINYAEIRKERDNKLKSLFKIAFEGGNTSLANIDVLEIKQFDVDSEIKKADSLLNDISKQTSLHDLTPTYKEEEIKALKDKLLPPNKKSTDIINKRKEVRDGDKGIDSELLSLAETEEKNVWDIREYDPLTPEILNEFLNACEGVEAKVGKEENGIKDGDDLNQYLKDQGAFEMDTEIIAKEDQLPKATRGTYALPEYYKMNNYNKDEPDFYPKNNNPKKYTDKTLEYLKNKYFENGDIFTDGKFKLKGHLAIGTGVGCVVHQEPAGDGSYVSHGSYKVEMNKLVDGLSIMEPKYFNAYMAATLCDTSVLNSSKGGKNVTPEQKAQFEANVAKIKEYVVPNGSLVVFDEADFAIPEYLEMIRDTIILTDDNNNAKFRVLKMSATFKGKKFSINSSYPIESYYTSGFQSGTPLKLEDRLGKGKTLTFLKSIDSKQVQKGVTILKKGAGEKETVDPITGRKATGNGVCHVVYDSTYEAFMEGISFGLPKGAIGIGDTRY
ncbi:8173_t:CDS:2 [Funneliformis geosporum]|uniref:8173_t:CDS:1 n=1 Tax=Funneliformis geosporum TaxID=1117311 RepID=A0A9W4T0D5_9GLOM|nr:8173_t:CDS:2 [Funneliformis geosporum]